ncbi:MAG: copper-translocating P-type ATPase [Candidatus Thermoplasmatota archaeon]|nr:copper-translocating P-type ATPase [Candidatus Thermoplasmatota archaeon]
MENDHNKHHMDHDQKSKHDDKINSHDNSSHGKHQMANGKKREEQGRHQNHNANGDHSDHHKMMAKDFKKRFIVSLAVTVPILALSPLIQDLIGLEFGFTGDKYLLFVLSGFIFFYGGYPFLKGIFKELGDLKPGMMTLIALAISVAFFYSSAVVFGLRGKFFFWELATLIDVMLLGHWIEMRSVMGASKALEKLAQLMPNEAHLITDKGTKDVKVNDLKKGDKVLIKAGEKIPADGVIFEGETHLDESMLTGESKPVKKSPNDEVIGGSVNGDNLIKVEIKETGEDSYLSKVIKLVKSAQSAKSKTQRLADKAAVVLTVIALVVGSTTLIFWLIYGSDISFAVERMATVMVITCPHALGLAIPLVNAVSTSKAAKNGLLIRNRTAFENSRKITMVVFDKTGTLTEGSFGLSLIESLEKDLDENDMLKIASSIERNSEHPIGKSIVEGARKKGIEISDVSDFNVLKGEGVSAKFEGEEYKLVSRKYMERNGIEDTSKKGTEGISTEVYILRNDEIIGKISLGDRIREESFEAVKMLQKNGKKCWMLTGDNERIAKEVSESLKLDGYFAEVLPHEKQEKIKELQKNGEFVAMTGDGINDAPALAQADIGIAVGSGTDVAAETADIILVNSNPRDIVDLISFGEATYKKMIQNLFWATGYNVVAIPLAAGVLFGVGIVISPAVGAGLMSLSTVIVAINARFLKIR